MFLSAEIIFCNPDYQEHFLLITITHWDHHFPADCELL
jgi:hypothetical protein